MRRFIAELFDPGIRYQFEQVHAVDIARAMQLDAKFRERKLGLVDWGVAALTSLTEVSSNLLVFRVILQKPAAVSSPTFPSRGATGRWRMIGASPSVDLNFGDSFQFSGRPARARAVRGRDLRAARSGPPAPAHLR